MDLGMRTPLLDSFKRGDVPREARLAAAEGAVAPRAHEQLALLMLLASDSDAEVAQTAERTLASIPRERLAELIDHLLEIEAPVVERALDVDSHEMVPVEMRESYVGKGERISGEASYGRFRQVTRSPDR